jgi:uncharacterized DUF497 family protein
VGRGKAFQCEITVSPGVQEKLSRKHDVEIWEIEEIIYDDPWAFSMTHRVCYFVYGQTYAGRYLLALNRILSPNEVSDLGLPTGTNVLRIITARDMNRTQRNMYIKRKGGKG